MPKKKRGGGMTTEFGKFADAMLIGLADESLGKQFKSEFELYGSLLLCVATKINNMKAIKYLLQFVSPSNASIPQNTFKDLLHSTDEAKDIETILLINRLLSKSPQGLYTDPTYTPWDASVTRTRDPIIFENLPLNFASNEAAAELLISAKANVNAIAQHTTPLHNACKTFNIPFIAFLTRLSEIDVNVLVPTVNDNLSHYHDYGTALHIITNTFLNAGYTNEKYRLEMLRLILAKEPNLDIVGCYLLITPLGVACRCGMLNLAEQLISAGANVDGSLLQIMCPLQAAISSYQVDAVKLLLKNKANVNREAGGETVIATAAKCMDANMALRMLTIFVRYNADVNIVNSSGRNVLHSYFDFNRGREIDNRIVRYLLKSGVHINQRDDTGDTPLLKALKYFIGIAEYMPKEYFETVSILLNAQADIHAQNQQQVSPLSFMEVMVKTNMFDAMRISSDIMYDIMLRRPTRASTALRHQQLQNLWEQGQSSNSNINYERNKNLNRLYSMLLEEKQRREEMARRPIVSRSRKRSDSAPYSVNKSVVLLERRSQTAGKAK